MRFQHILAEFGEFTLEAAGENWEAAPSFGVEIFVVDVETRRVAFALPLIAGPEAEEAVDPGEQLLGGVLAELGLHDFKDFHRTVLVANGGALDGVEQIVGH